MLRQLLFITLTLVVIAQIVQGDSDCENQRNKVLGDLKKGMFGEFIPSCDADGNYKKAQCNAYTGYCFCVDPMTGKQIGEKTMGEAKCE
ncbi:testican-1-like [Argiope bruennichi]|uniref:testican-1-like n=1 Tax=Argiope bruennichi TaxID=94029 RepID=UPI002493E0DD|nr:testican-1-like [Argiope bruennichi]